MKVVPEIAFAFYWKHFLKIFTVKTKLGGSLWGIDLCQHCAVVKIWIFTKTRSHPPSHNLLASWCER